MGYPIKINSQSPVSISQNNFESRSIVWKKQCSWCTSGG